MVSMTSRPPFLFRNSHVNTIFGSNGPRAWLVQHRARSFARDAVSVTLACGGGVQLHGLFNRGWDSSKGLVVLLHGWEGTANSTYLLSAALALSEAGFSVFRLHMRDHGPTHHLNREPFLAVRLDEMLDAMDQIHRLFPHPRMGLAGFSLGANFVVRIAAKAHERAFALDQAVAISPPIDPMAAAHAIQSYPVYNRYFIHKWQRSFARKIALFDDYAIHRDLLDHHDILQMHEDFIPRFSDYQTAQGYFDAYALSGDNLDQMPIPCRVVMVEDDPIIPVGTVNRLPTFDNLTLEVVPHGGHCGFLASYGLDSWADALLLSLFLEQEKAD